MRRNFDELLYDGYTLISKAWLSHAKNEFNAEHYKRYKESHAKIVRNFTSGYITGDEMASDLSNEYWRESGRYYAETTPECKKDRAAVKKLLEYLGKKSDKEAITSAMLGNELTINNICGTEFMRYSDGTIEIFMDMNGKIIDDENGII